MKFDTPHEEPSFRNLPKVSINGIDFSKVKVQVLRIFEKKEELFYDIKLEEYSGPRTLKI